MNDTDYEVLAHWLEMAYKQEGDELHSKAAQAIRTLLERPTAEQWQEAKEIHQQACDKIVEIAQERDRLRDQLAAATPPPPWWRISQPKQGDG